MKIRRTQSGFTLLELLVVMVIAGLMLGVVSFNAMPSQRQRLENDAKRIALLFQLARDEAICAIHQLPLMPINTLIGFWCAKITDCP